MKDNTFVIDSRNLDAVESRLYGCLATDDGRLIFEMPPEGTASSAGAFCLVEAGPDSIVVRQDFCGTFSLFLYREEGRFLLSNSFFRLADCLAGKLTSNRLATLALVYANEAPLCHTDTIANEIQRIPSNVVVRIGKRDGSIRLERHPYTYYSTDPRSPEALAQLDAWYWKWVRILRGLVQAGYPIVADLSGGLDTRLILSMLINGNIDLPSSIRITSHAKAKIGKDVEDLQIASQIASDLGIPFNERIPAKDITVNAAEQAYRMQRLISLGNTVNVKYSYGEYDKPVICLKGLAARVKGESWDHVRGMLYASEMQLPIPSMPLRSRLKAMARYSEMKRYYQAEFEKMIAECEGAKDSPDGNHQSTAVGKLFRVEYFDMKKVAYWMSENRIVVSPFFDSAISVFDYNPYKDDLMFLATLMFDRYAPDLLRYDVQGRSLNPDSTARARELNRRHPAKKPAFPRLEGHEEPRTRTRMAEADIAAYIEGIWESADFRRRVVPIVGDDIYRDVLRKTERASLGVSHQPINGLLAVYELSQLLKG